MEYIYIGAAALGGGWTGYLIGQFSSVKEMNRRLNALALDRDSYKQGVVDCLVEIDRLSDLVAKYQRNQPEREANGKFASKKKRVTAELAAYVASKAV